MKKTKLIFKVFTVSMLLIAISCQEVGTNAPVKTPDHLITVEKGLSLYDNFTRNRVPLIENFENMQDSVMIESSDKRFFQATRAGWIDFQTLKDYVRYVEDLAQQGGEQVSGVRIYYGQYGEDEDYAKRTTMFMMPTIKHRSNGNTLDHLGFVTRDREGKKEIVLISDMVEGIRSSRGARNLTTMQEGDGDYDPTMLNEMTMWPPPRKPQGGNGDMDN